MGLDKLTITTIRSICSIVGPMFVFQVALAPQVLMKHVDLENTSCTCPKHY